MSNIDLECILGDVCGVVVAARNGDINDDVSIEKLISLVDELASDK